MEPRDRQDVDNADAAELLAEFVVDPAADADEQRTEKGTLLALEAAGQRRQDMLTDRADQPALKQGIPVAVEQKEPASPRGAELGVDPL